jgi:hypothetical protein
MDTIQNYKVLIEPDNQEEGVYGISLVEDPAVHYEFIAFNKQKEVLMLSTINDEKRIVTGVVLVPNMVIPRYSEKTKTSYNLQFEEETILKLSQKFFTDGYQLNSNINHNPNDVINGLVFFESWLVLDPQNDKSKALGFTDLPKGTWMASAHIKNDETWARVKSGEVKGFSIEAFLEMEQIDLSINKYNKNNKKQEMSILNELKRIVAKLSGEETKLESEYEVGQKLLCAGEPAEFEDNGYLIKVDENCFITSIEAVQPIEEEPVEELLSEEVVTEEQLSEEATAAAEEIASDVEEIAVEVEQVVEQVDIEALNALVADLQTQIEVLKSEKEKLTMSNEELKTQPITTKLKANSVVDKKETTLDVLSRIANTK